MAAGFRESGIGSNNLVGIRISLKLDVPIAKLDPLSRRIVPLVSDEFVVEHLDIMMRDRFRENFRRRDVLHGGITRDFFNSSSDKSNEFEPKRFNDLTQRSTASVEVTVAAATASANKEDKEARRERKRREGLLRQADRQKEKAAARLLKQQLQEQNPE